MALPDAAKSQVTAIVAGLDNVYERMARACQRAGRRANEVTLVGVTKTFPLETIAAALAAGLQDFGENRPQELEAKARATPPGVCRYHLIGHLQRNKARIAIRYAHLFHALDSLRLADALNQRAQSESRVLPCLVQVNVSAESTKFGVPPAETHRFLETLASKEHLRIQGLMTLAAPTAEPEEVRPQFRKMRQLLAAAPLPEMTTLSMGMSGDFEVAIEEGATHIRVGSAIFGPRIH